MFRLLIQYAASDEEERPLPLRNAADVGVAAGEPLARNQRANSRDPKVLLQLAGRQLGDAGCRYPRSIVDQDVELLGVGGVNWKIDELGLNGNW